MRKMIKRLMTFILAFGMIFGTLPGPAGGMITLNAEIKTLSTSTKTGYGHVGTLNWYRTDLNRRTNHIWGAVDLYKLDGEAVYCVNPWVEAVNGTTYENSDFYEWYGDNNTVDYIRKGDNENAEKLIYTESMIETLALIAFFGYDYPGHQTNEYYAAAQKIIWENITGKEVVIYKMNETANQENGCWAEGCYGSQVADLSYEMNEIYSLIENYRKHISYSYTYQKSEDHSVGNAVDVNDVKVGDVIKVTVSGADLKYYRFQKDKLINMAFCDEDGTIWSDTKLNSMNTDSAMASLNNVFYVTLISAGTAQFGLASRELAYFSGQKPFLFKGIGDTRTQEMIRRGDVRNPDGKDGVFTVKASPKINLTIEKKDPSGNFVSGAKIAIYDGNTQVYSCTTGTATIRELDIKTLKPGKTYTVKELEVPTGYVKAKDTTFSIPSSITEDYTVTVKMTDGQVFASKVDQNGKALSGASMQVLLGSTVIDSWTTDGKAHAVNGLEEGKTYTLHEVKAPDGYLLAADQTFTASSKTVNLTATDRQVTAQKKDSNGSSVSGAKMQVLLGTKVIDEWTTDGKVHPIKGLEKGKEYILREVTAPKGYVKAKDVKFTVNDDLAEVSMTDGQVKAKKVDAAGKAISGIKLQVLQGTTVIDEWTTDGSDHIINGLSEGTSYKLHEAEAPAGYALAADITFTASTKVQTLTMTDVTVSVTKADDLGQQLKGAVLQILEGTKVIAEWTTDGTAYKPKGLRAGVEYTLHEKSAPNGYDVAVDQKFTIKDKNITLKAVDKRKPIKVTAIKTDAYDKTVRLSGAEFTVYSKKDDSVAKLTNGKDAVVKTNDKGVAEFSLYYNTANYYLKETGAPEGYSIDEPDKKYDITADGVFEFTFTASDTSKAEISMIKVDAETGERTQGDAKYVGAEYEVTDTKLNKVFGTFTLGEDGKSTAPIKGIALDGRTYVLKETKAPEGYQLSSETAEFVPTQKEYVLTVTHKDSVKKNHIRVMKVYDNSDKAAQVQPEKDAEFTIILKSFVEKYASFEEAYEALKADNTLLLESEWDSGKTSETGEWTSRDLAYGKYILKQTVTPDEEVMIATEEIEVNITGDETSDIVAHFSNKPMKYRLRIVKKDADTGKTVEYTSAVFKIRTESGKYLEYRVGRTDYDSWKTTSKNPGDNKGLYYDENDENGYATYPDWVQGGTKYTVEEIITPDGFLELAEPVTFEIRAANAALVNIDGEPYFEVVIKNDRPSGTLEVTKTLERAEGADKSFIDEDAITKIEFSLSAKEDIIDVIDGSVICKAGEAYGTYHPDPDGKFTVTDLPLGLYELKETTAPNGIVKDETVHEVKIEQKDTTTKVYTVSHSITNKTTGIKISKKAVTGDEELAGATLQVKDSKGDVVDEWISGTKEHFIEGLKIDEEYTLTETITPKDENGEDLGYAKATDIKFQVKEDGGVDTVTMINKVVTMTKKDVGGEEVPGAKMSVTDEEGNVVDEWTSIEEPHKIKNLEVGKKYILHEDTAPAGYVKATDIPFTVEDDGQDQHIEMIDMVYTVSKTDVGGQELPGAKMSITDEEGHIIDEWTSAVEEHRVSGLEAGKTYTLHEDTAPLGYVKATDVTFTVTEDGIDHKIKMIDKVLTVSKQDLGGKEVSGAKITVYEGETVVDEWTSVEEPHKVTGLEAGKTYKMVEEAEPDGYYYAEDIEFTVKDDGIDQTEIMKDQLIRYQVAKIDDITGDYVAGVRLRLWDITVTEDSGEYPMELISPEEGWITEDKPLDISKYLKAGHQYVLEESDIIDGVYQADNIEFEVPKYNPGNDEIITITMVDTTTSITVIKTDQTGLPLAGAKMSIIDDYGNVVYEWISSTEPEDISEYVMGNEHYILREDEAPFGFNEIHDMDFTVTGTHDHHQIIVVTDTLKTMYVSVLKVDAQDNTKLLKGAKIAIYYNDDNTIALDINGKEAVGVTDGAGSLTFELPYSKRGYYAMEIEAPEGYRLSNEHYDLVPTEDYGFAKDNPVKIIVNNEGAPTVKTGDNSNRLLFAGLFGLSIAVVFMAFFMKRKMKA